jgi:hypothetical protein
LTETINLVELTAANGSKVSVNPAAVVCITDATDENQRPVLGTCLVYFLGAPPMPISKARSDVAELLAGGVVLEGA